MIRVVIADDEDKVCQLICSLINWKELDMEIVGIAHDGIQALELIKENLPDLVITDIRMPGYDGLEMISKGKELKSDLEFIIISGYRHFEYAQSAIKYGVCDYMLKPIKKADLLATLQKLRDRYYQRIDRLTKEERLKLRLQNDIEKLRSGLFTEVLLSKNTDKINMKFEELNDNYHFRFCDGCFQILTIKMDCETERDIKMELKVLEDKVLQVAFSFLKQECFDMELYFDSNNAYCILNYDKLNKKGVRKQIKSVLNELTMQREIFTQFEFTIGLGSIVENSQELKFSLSSSKYATDQRLLLGTGGLIEYEEPKTNNKNIEFMLSYMNKSMGAALEILDKEGVLTALNDMQLRIKSIPDISGETIFEMANQIFSMFINNLRNKQIKMDEELYQNFCLNANRCGSVEKLFGYLSAVIGRSLDNIIENKKMEDTKPIRIAKQYIQQNFAKSISLDEVSNVAGFNASYFSSLFKKECGVNFLEYISEIRMNKAKELLRESNLSISTICEEVGYIDLKHFTKSFKKYTGVKPNEYRKLYS